MRIHGAVCLIFVSLFVQVRAQIAVKKLKTDTSIIWQEDRFFIHEYVLSNFTHQPIELQIQDSNKNMSDCTVLYSLNGELTTNSFLIKDDNVVFRVWIRYNSQIQEKDICFSLKSNVFLYTDTIHTKFALPQEECIHNYKIINHLDFYTSRNENIELQLFDDLWNLIAVKDAKKQRMDFSLLPIGSYFLKINQHIFTIEKVDVNQGFPLQTYSTIDHNTNQ